MKQELALEGLALNEFLSGSLSCSTRSQKKFLTTFSFSVHENLIGSTATENLLLMLCAWVVSHC